MKDDYILPILTTLLNIQFPWEFERIYFLNVGVKGLIFRGITRILGFDQLLTYQFCHFCDPCRKLADITRDNILDISEFIVAMHLIQSRLRGMEIPQKLPQNLMPIGVTQLEVPAMSQAEKDAYDRAFAWRDNDKTGFLSGMLQVTVNATQLELLGKSVEFV